MGMLTKELSRLPAVQPSFIEPMYAQAVRNLSDGTDWIYEAKLDGYRCLAAKRTDGVALCRRRSHQIKLLAGTLIDGEVVATDEKGRMSFNTIQHNRPNAQCVGFRTRAIGTRSGKLRKRQMRVRIKEGNFCRSIREKINA